MQEIEATVAAMSEPVSVPWCMVRVAALLSPYYDKDTPQAVRKMEAEDWLEALGEYPQWAIERAVRWWKSAENADRRKKPLEGDVAARCIVEMRGIGSLPELLARKVQGRYIEVSRTAPKRLVTADAAREIIARAGFAPRKMENRRE